MKKKIKSKFDNILIEIYKQKKQRPSTENGTTALLLYCSVGQNFYIYYNWHRYYSGKIGRYLSKDPIVWNLGGYLDEFYDCSLENPITNFDL